MSPLFGAAGVAGLPAVDVGDALGVHGDRTDDGVVLVGGLQPHRRHHDQPVRIQAAGLVRLGATDIDAFGSTTHDMKEEVRIGLLRRRSAAIALHVGHRTANDHVCALHARQELLEPRVVVGPALLVQIVCHRVQRVERIHADAALEARARQLPKTALHLVLHDEIAGARGDMEEAVYAATGEGRDGGSQFGILVREIVSLRDRVDRRPDDGVVDRLFDELAHQIDLQPTTPEAFDVFGAGLDRIPRPGRTRWRRLPDPSRCLHRCGPAVRAHPGCRDIDLLQPFFTSGQALSLSGRNA